jgi:hypothetical protein
VYAYIVARNPAYKVGAQQAGVSVRREDKTRVAKFGCGHCMPPEGTRNSRLLTARILQTGVVCMQKEVNEYVI